MKVILHIGAHRCAATGLQAFLEARAGMLQTGGIKFWGPSQVRHDLLPALRPTSPARGANGQVLAAARRMLDCTLRRLRNQGYRRLLVSDQMLIGAMRENLRLAQLYGGVAQGAPRIAQLFGDWLGEVVLIVRPLDAYWTSLLTHAVAFGERPATPPLLERISTCARGWLEVAQDLAQALPQARLTVIPMARLCAAPGPVLGDILAKDTPCWQITDALPRRACAPALSDLRAQCRFDSARLRGAGEHWAPFNAVQRDRLRQRYKNDLQQLAAGIEANIRLGDHRAGASYQRAGAKPDAPNLTRGGCNDRQEANMDRPG